MQEEFEQTVANRSDPEAEVRVLGGGHGVSEGKGVKLRLLSFLRNEIEALQRELQVGIPVITLHEETDVE